VELSRHSHKGPEAAKRAMKFLQSKMTNDEIKMPKE
jgi:hypothetical protein